MEWDVQFLHGEAVVDLQGEMVQEDGLVTLEQEPVFDLTNDVLLALGLLILLSN